MFQRLVHFIKYHNALPIAISIVVAGSGAAFAATNDAVRDQVVSKEVVMQSVDNSYVLSVDLAAFNPGLQVTAVEEDEEFYYVTYAYRTIAIDDYAWKDRYIEETLAVSKEVLGERDLGSYVAEELGQTVEARMAYLKDVQSIEKRNGVTKKVATVTYSGLVGKFLEPKQEFFEGYTPVKEEPKPYVASVEESKASAAIAAANAVSNQIAAAIPSKEEVERIIERKVAELLKEGKLTASAAGADTTNETGATSPTDTSGGVSGDTEAPVITVLGNNPAEIEVGASYVDLGATVEDNVDNNLGIHYAVDGAEVGAIAIDTSTDRTYTITYSATDQAGNTGTAERVVIVGTGEYTEPESEEPVEEETPVEEPAQPEDITAPIITLIGDSEITLTEGDTYTEAGATATDEIDGDITDSIVIEGTVDTATPGEYTLSYNVSDAAGNGAVEVVRVVIIEAAPEQTPEDNETATSTPSE
ncbi:MAG: DUF5011 domain-containing protein [Candidatus Pacebacteria bacterium]|nr:DUF5011 domain-containing protein [Candidatus Paceibacterota bacterium]